MRFTSMRRRFYLLSFVIGLFILYLLYHARNSNKYIDHSKLNNDFLIVPSKLSAKKFRLIILVLSAVENINQRVVIRQTWASIASNFNTAVIFIIGTNEYVGKQQYDEEAELFQDLIQVNVEDHHRRLVQKLLPTYKFISSFMQSDFVLKTDDDCFVNIPLLHDYLVNFSSLKSILVGHKIDKAMVVSDPHYKYYYASPTEGTLFPEYLSGTGYLMSSDVFQSFTACPLKPIPIEDVFYTGLCRKFFNITLIDSNKFGYQSKPAVVCLFVQHIIIHGISPEHMNNTWKQLLNPNLFCSTAETHNDFS